MQGLFRRRNLPHWDVEGSPTFITGCLHGSLSHAGMAELTKYRHELEERPCPQGLCEEEWQHRHHKMLFAKMDQLLDHHSPVRHLEADNLAKTVANAFLHFCDERYQLLAFVVMPSHHHWLFTVQDDWAMTELERRKSLNKRFQTPREIISHSIQSYTGQACNKLLKTSGRFWQQETFDHWVRETAEAQRIIQYIENNPVQAGLTQSPEQFRWSSAYLRTKFELGQFDAIPRGVSYES